MDSSSLPPVKVDDEEIVTFAGVDSRKEVTELDGKLPSDPLEYAYVAVMIELAGGTNPRLAVPNETSM